MLTTVQAPPTWRAFLDCVRSLLLAIVMVSCGWGTERSGAGVSGAALARSAQPPGGLQIAQVPQFVAVTFDDNFSSEGMDWALRFFRPLRNGAGSGNRRTFDGAPARATFPCNSLYLGGMQATWQLALNDGHEIANHTVNHGDGIAYSVDQWNQEIATCTAALRGGLSSQGQPISIGFRSPYLHYDDNLFTVLVDDGFVYDTSIMECWADAENGKSCAWPYTLDSGSPDADTIYSKWQGRNVVPVSAHPGLWEIPVAVVFVPDDSLASQYGFPAGLRQRLQNRLGNAQNPSFFEQSTGKMVGMDVSMLLDGQMTRAEALATLKYTLDLRLAGNRAPLIVVAHTHVYASSWDANAPGVPDTDERRSIIEDFVNYALSKPEVRIRPIADLAAWMSDPVALGSCTPTTCAAQGKNCGDVSDGCGGTLSCGTCALNQTCARNACQPPSGCAATVTSYALGTCNATTVYGGKLYKCISQAVGVNGEARGCGTTGVYCSSIAPDHPAWGSTAWQLVQSCS